MTVLPFTNVAFFPEKNPKTLYVLYDKKMLVRFTKEKIENLIVELRLCSLLYIFMY